MSWNISGDEEYKVTWAIHGCLAHSQRPGYPASRPPLERVHEWADEAMRMGLRSVICLLGQQEVSLYDRLNLDGGGLFGYYRTLGLEVVYVEAEDYKTPPLSAGQLETVWRAYCRLDKSVLVHCSAGRDRTGAAVTHIRSQLDTRER